MVVATMDNMGTAVMSLKQLGVSEKPLSFRFHDQEIAAFIHPPYLFKWWSVGL
jgi:hypothetical protein